MTNLRTSAWEATSLVAKQNFALGRHGDRKRKTSLNNSPIAGRFIPQTERTYKTGKVLLFYVLGREGKTEKKNPFLVTQKPCLSAGILLVAIPWVDNSYNTFKQSYIAQTCKVGTTNFATTPPISFSRCLLGEIKLALIDMANSGYGCQTASK